MDLVNLNLNSPTESNGLRDLLVDKESNIVPPCAATSFILSRPECARHLTCSAIENIDTQAPMQAGPLTHYRVLLVSRDLGRQLEVSGDFHVLDDRQQGLQAVLLRDVRAAPVAIKVST